MSRGRTAGHEALHGVEPPVLVADVPEVVDAVELHEARAADRSRHGPRSLDRDDRVTPAMQDERGNVDRAKEVRDVDLVDELEQVPDRRRGRALTLVAGVPGAVRGVGEGRGSEEPQHPALVRAPRLEAPADTPAPLLALLDGLVRVRDPRRGAV